MSYGQTDILYHRIFTLKRYVKTERDRKREGAREIAQELNFVKPLLALFFTLLSFPCLYLTITELTPFQMQFYGNLTKKRRKVRERERRERKRGRVIDWRERYVEH